MLGIPQPTLSAYESGKIKPTVDAIINICDKCNVSMDWLCGRDTEFSINTLGDVMACFLELFETKEFEIETTVHDRIDVEDPNSNDDNDRNWVSLKVYHNESAKKPELTLNRDLAHVITKAYKLSQELRRFERDQESYERDKAYSIENMQDVPLTKIDYSKLTDEERRNKMFEIMKAERENTDSNS